MTRTQLLQEIRRMRFEEACGGWQETRLTQEEVHNDGVAGERCADCKVPRWFEPDARIHLTLPHVFDFLNQMGWMARSPIHVEADRVVVWLPFQDDLGPAAETPRIVSMRPLVVEPHESGFRYGFSAVFEDGMFG